LQAFAFFGADLGIFIADLQSFEAGMGGSVWDGQTASKKNLQIFVAGLFEQ
jgi:hypothetical protein